MQLVFTPNSDTPYAGLPLDLSTGPMVVELPPGGNNEAANALMKTVKVYPLNRPAEWKEASWVSLKTGDFTPLQWETNLQFWQVLHEVIDAEPAYAVYRAYYGELAGLGIVKGQPFSPDARMRAILEKAAKIANAQMRVQSFADRRPERMAWPDRKWEWATLRPENGTFDAPTYKDLDARGKWFYQAQVESPAMFRRSPGAGSLYWLGTRDKTWIKTIPGKGWFTYFRIKPHSYPGRTTACVHSHHGCEGRWQYPSGKNPGL